MKWQFPTLLSLFSSFLVPFLVSTNGVIKALVRVVWFPPRLAPDHMLGFGIGRNIWFLVRKEINRIRIMIWKMDDKRYPAKS